MTKYIQCFANLYLAQGFEISVDVGAGHLAVLAWFACCLGCSVVWMLLGVGLLGIEVVQHWMQQKHGLQAAAQLPFAQGLLNDFNGL